MQATQATNAALPVELGQKDKSHKMWALFALFIAIAPFIVILIPKIAGPVVLFGALVFCAIFLFKDQKSNLHKNAKELWSNSISGGEILVELILSREAKADGAEFFFQLKEKLPQFESRNFIVSLESDGGRDFLERQTSQSQRVELKNVELVHKDDIDELILVSVNDHRFWCRPWNYQLDFGEQLERFQESKAPKEAPGNQ